MLDFDTMLRRTLQNANVDSVAIAMRYDLPDRVCRDLIAQGLAQAYVADSIQPSQPDPLCAGWWVDRDQGSVHLRQGVASTLLIAGVDRTWRVGAATRSEAIVKGVRRIVTGDRMGEILEDLQIDAERAAHLPAHDATPSVTDPRYEDAFEEMYDLVGGKLRVRDRCFASDRLILCLGSLGPGGAERQSAYTAVGIRERDRLDTYIACHHVDPPADFFRPYVERSGVKVIRVNDAPPEFATPEIARIHLVLKQKYWALGFDDIFIEIVRYVSLLRAMRPAVVHTWMDYSNALCGTAATLVGVPALVLSCRSVAPDHFRIFQPYMRPAYRALLRRRDAVVLNNSRAGASDYARWLHIPRDRLHVIHNGFEFPDIASPQSVLSVRERYAIPDGAQIVGSILRFSEEKRPQLLIDMARELYAVEPSVRFLFFGGGVMLEEMRDYVASFGLEDVIRLPGVTTASWEVLAAMDLFVLTARMEGLPNVLVEAQASGVPVICTRVGGACETFIEGETGISVQEATPSALATAAREILVDAQRHRQMSTRAVTHARDAFSLQQMIEATHGAYNRARKAGRSNNHGESGKIRAPEEMRFAFGRNWSKFVRKNFSQQRCDIAKKRILDFIDRRTLECFDFLDIGCGSGLHSLAAWQSGARGVHSFDYDRESVAATKILWQRAGSPSNWTVERGDVLDADYISSLGRWSLVYSWGVLHHTGSMWQAVENAQSTVAHNGLLYMALYSSDASSQASPQFWLDTKRRYNQSSFLQKERMVWWYVWNFMLDKKMRNTPQLIKRVFQHKLQRGMDLFTDIRDWLGGWPMEYAGDQETVDFLEQRLGFSLLNIATGQACSEFLFHRAAVQARRTIVQEFVANRSSVLASFDLGSNVRAETQSSPLETPR